MNKILCAFILFIKNLLSFGINSFDVVLILIRQQLFIYELNKYNLFVL